MRTWLRQTFCQHINSTKLRTWLRQTFCRHINSAIEFHDDDNGHWTWTCYSCGKVRGL